MKKRFLPAIIAALCALSLNISPAQAWHDETHLAIAKAADYPKWYNAAGPDMAKIKAGAVEDLNHYSNNIGLDKVTPEIVLGQSKRYNEADDTGGHLYGAIIASLHKYAQSQREGKYPQYHLAYCVHYIGDLSQPLHNVPYDDFNQLHHRTNDGIIENEALKNIDKIKRNMYRINLRADNLEVDLARETARIANLARALSNQLKRDNRDMSQEEAYRQLGHSASLFKAVLDCVNHK